MGLGLTTDMRLFLMNYSMSKFSTPGSFISMLLSSSHLAKNVVLRTEVTALISSSSRCPNDILMTVVYKESKSLNLSALHSCSFV